MAAALEVAVRGEAVERRHRGADHRRVAPGRGRRRRAIAGAHAAGARCSGHRAVGAGRCGRRGRGCSSVGTRGTASQRSSSVGACSQQPCTQVVGLHAQAVDLERERLACGGACAGRACRPAPARGATRRSAGALRARPRRSTHSACGERMPASSSPKKPAMSCGRARKLARSSSPVTASGSAAAWATASVAPQEPPITSQRAMPRCSRTRRRSASRSSVVLCVDAAARAAAAGRRAGRGRRCGSAPGRTRAAAAASSPSPARRAAPRPGCRRPRRTPAPAAHGRRARAAHGCAARAGRGTGGGSGTRRWYRPGEALAASSIYGSSRSRFQKIMRRESWSGGLCAAPRSARPCVTG